MGNTTEHFFARPSIRPSVPTLSSAHYFVISVSGPELNQEGVYSLLAKRISSKKKLMHKEDRRG